MKHFFVIVLIVAILACIFAPFVGGAIAFAEDSQYSDALTDLCLDQTFSISQWPSIANSYSLKLITLAESINKELFVYVYQPGATSVSYRATKIRMSLDYNETYDYTGVQDYDLTYINNNGVFFKYKVAGFTVSNDADRKYVIISLFRPFVSNHDTDADLDNVVNLVPYDVSRMFTFTISNNATEVTATQVDTIIVTSKIVGFVRYEDSAFGYKAGMDRHFVAFSTNRNIDDLMRVKLSYVKQYAHVETSGVSYEWQFDSPQTITKNIYDFETQSYTYYAFGRENGNTITWPRITSGSSFVNSVSGVQGQKLCHIGSLNLSTYSEMDSAEKALISAKDWVVSFDYTLFFDNPNGIGELLATWSDAGSERSIVSEVTILELQFVTDGIMYNLGVVDNYQTGSDSPVNNTTTKVTTKDGKDITAVFKAIVLLVGVAVLGIVLLPVLVRIIRYIVGAVGSKRQ